MATPDLLGSAVDPQSRANRKLAGRGPPLRTRTTRPSHYMTSLLRPDRNYTASPAQLTLPQLHRLPRRARLPRLDTILAMRRSVAVPALLAVSLTAAELPTLPNFTRAVQPWGF